MQRLLGYAHEAELISLALHPSDEARTLYADLGFNVADEVLIHLTQG